MRYGSHSNRLLASLLCCCLAVVSDYRNGGQVVMDHVTFAAVKDTLTVLELWRLQASSNGLWLTL
jgi:hypothetical protein